jgi:hypothetical protein
MSMSQASATVRALGRIAVSTLLIGTGLAACSTEPTTVRPLLDDAAGLAKGGGGGGGGTTVTVTVTPTSPGVAPSPDDQYTVSIPSGGYVDIKPQCSGTDRIDLQGMGTLFDALGARSTCNGSGGAGFVFLKPLVNLSSAVNAACADQDAPARTKNAWNFGVTSRYFFQVDGPDSDTAFDDTQYTLVLKDCFVHAVAGQPTWRRVTASVGDLYAGQTGTPMASFTNIAVNVDVTFRP